MGKLCWAGQFTPVIPAVRRLVPEDFCELEAFLGYMDSSTLGDKGIFSLKMRERRQKKENRQGEP